MLLILDLDDTIFATQSIGIQVVAPAINIIDEYFAEKYGADKSRVVIRDLWKMPFDAVARKHSIPKQVQNKLLKTLQALDFILNIEVYPDYPFLKALPCRKILVTTGFKKLQLAKISALDIAVDFESVHIDDPFDAQRPYKKGIFQSILRTTKLSPSEVWVIGDNPTSELQAGHVLGMHTVQRVKAGEKQATFVEKSIKSFEELKDFPF